MARLRGRNDGVYQLQAAIGSTGVIERGTYRIHPLAYDLTRLIEPLSNGQPVAGQGVVVRILATGGETWLKVLSSGKQGGWPCWVRADTALAPLTGITGDAPTLPAAVGAMLSARGTGLDGSEVVGSTDLLSAVAVLGEQAVAGFGLEAGTPARLPARFDIQHGDVVGWSEDVADVPAAMTQAGLTVPSAAANLSSQKLPVSVLFKRATSISIAAPAHRSVVKVRGTTSKALNRAMSRCRVS